MFKLIKQSLLSVALAGVVLASNASADQFVARHGGRDVVVHTSPVPVILHRMVPPNYGRHITLREYHARQRAKR